VNKMNLRKEVKKLFEQTDEGAVETEIKEAFEATLPQYDLTDNSIKVSKIDTTSDITLGTLKYKMGSLNINSAFVYKKDGGILCLGER